MRSVNYLLTIFAFLSVALAGSAGLNHLNAQDEIVSETLSLTGFDQVEISGAWEVELVPGQAHQVRVEVSADMQEHVSLEVQGTRLIANADLQERKRFSLFGNPKSWKNYTLRIYVAAPELKGIAVSGATELQSSGVIRTDICSLDITGASDVTLEVEVDKLEMNVTGASDITLSGTAHTLEAKIKGASNLSASDMMVSKASITTKGACSTELAVEDLLEAETSGASYIGYSGNPTVQRSSSGASYVQKR